MGATGSRQTEKQTVFGGSRWGWVTKMSTEELRGAQERYREIPGDSGRAAFLFEVQNELAFRESGSTNRQSTFPGTDGPNRYPEEIKSAGRKNDGAIYIGIQFTDVGRQVIKPEGTP